MTDIPQAFGHPELRSQATASDKLADRISLRDHIVTVEIGAFQQERGTKQRICFNLVVEVAPHDGASDDDVDKILSYDTLTEAIAIELAAERLNLLETLAERIAKRILAEPQALRCFVRIEKLDRGPGALGVEIVRNQFDVVKSSQINSTGNVGALVVFLSASAQAAPHLHGWISQLLALARPVVICVDLPPGPRPHSANPLAQRRIDLLAIEQNAWVLAGQDARCVVINSRTELDWAMKQNALTVWAPSKIVLDSIERPAVGQHRGAALAAWFAGQIQAARFLVVGADLPETDVSMLAHNLADPNLPAL